MERKAEAGKFLLTNSFRTDIGLLLGYLHSWRYRLWRTDIIYILGNMCRWLVALVSLGVELQSMGRGNISATRVRGVGTIVVRMQNTDVTFPQPHGECE